MKSILKEHNKETFDNVIKLFKSNNRVAIEQATGTGKSYIIANIIEAGLFNNVLILAPSKYILDQFKNKFPYLNSYVEKLDFSTYAKTMFLDDDEIDESYDLIVLDEYHRLGAKKWGGSVNSILDKCTNAKILGATATPVRYFDNERNMTDEIFNGIVANKINLYKAIERKILSKPKYIKGFYSIKDDIDYINNEISKKNIDDKKIQQSIKYITSNFELLYGASAILKKYIKHERKFIVFCENTNHLLEVIPIVTSWFKNAFNEDVNVYSMFTDNNSSRFEFEEFKNANNNEFNLLFVINMMNEGVHIDGKDKVEGLIMLRRTSSPTIYYQQLGRGLTEYGEAPPIIFDLANNSRNIGMSNFTVIDSSNGMLKKEYNKINYDISSLFEIYDESSDILNILNNINSSISSWDIMYNQLVEYKKEHGDLNVPLSMKKLHKWKHKQVLFYKEGTLNPSRYEKLKDLGLSFDYLNEEWNKNFHELVAYKEKFGHTRISRHIGEYCKLGSWLDGQKKVYKNGNMKKDRIKLFKSIGVTFEELPISNIKWEDTYNKLVEYKNKLGTANVSSRDKEHKELSNWCKTQRTRYKEGKLEDYRVKKLTDIGFIFSRTEKAEIAWNKNFKQLEKLKKETGVAIPNKKSKNYNSLNSWRYRQMDDYKNGKLSKDKTDKLISIGLISEK